MPRRTLAGSLLAVLVLVLPAPAGAATLQQVRAKLAQEMRHAGPAAGAYVLRLDDDHPVYTLRADRPLIPASVNKLFVTATALRLHGPDATLDTVVLRDGDVDADGILHGSLYLRGGGDPTLSAARVEHLADAVEAAGITRVTGAVVGDESRFDALRGSTDTGGALDGEIGGELSALVTARGYARGGWQGRPAAVAADDLRLALKRRHVRVHGRSRVGVTPTEATELGRTSSVPIAELIARTNQPSDNFYAEMLLKDLGASFGGAGTTRAGAEVVQQEMAKLDVRPTIVDGSGLDRADRTNARTVVHLLDEMEAGDLGTDFVDSLGVVGRVGTVASRMRHTRAQGRCHTKTGTLHDVSNIAGICDTADGPVGFAFLMNAISPTWAHVLQDRMVEAVARLR